MKPKIIVDENGHKLISLNEVVNDYLNGIPKTENADLEFVPNYTSKDGTVQFGEYQKTEDIPHEVIEPEKSFDEKVKDFLNVGDNLQQAVYHAHSIEMYNIYKGLIEPNQLPDKSVTHVPE